MEPIPVNKAAVSARIYLLIQKYLLLICERMNSFSYRTGNVFQKENKLIKFMLITWSQTINFAPIFL